MKKLVLALVSGVLVLSLVAGCGQKEEAAAPVETPAASEAPVPAPAMENMTTSAAEAPAEAPSESTEEAY